MRTGGEFAWAPGSRRCAAPRRPQPYAPGQG